MHPAAVEARERRAKKRERRARVLTPDPAPPVRTLTPDAFRAETSAPGAPALLPLARADAEQSVAGMVKAIGFILAQFLGDHWEVGDHDATQTAKLCLDAWPQLANGAGDMAQLLAIGAIGGMVTERYRKGKALAAARGPVRTVAPPPDAMMYGKVDPVSL